jgi:hypothetical protein
VLIEEATEAAVIRIEGFIAKLAALNEMSSANSAVVYGEPAV